MKNSLFLTVILFLLPVCLSAQSNPKRGFIINHTGDTIRGTIDYRTLVRNVESCSFKADGADSYEKYEPQDIQAYGLTEGNALYVSRTLPVEGQQKTFFAEYLVVGELSLYRYAGNNGEIYYIEDLYGNITPFNRFSTRDKSNLEINELRRKNLSGVSQVFTKAPETFQKLLSTHLTAHEVSQVVKEYNEEFCSESGACVVYLQDKTSRETTRTRFRMEAGFITGRIHDEYMSKGTTSPQIAAGIDIELPRFDKHVSLQGLVSLTKWEVKDADYHDKNAELYSYRSPITKVDRSFFEINVLAGAVYKFLPDSKITPLVRGGIVFSAKTSIKGYDEEPGSALSEGVYLGAGAEWKVGTHRMSLTADYVYPNVFISDPCADGLALHLGFTF